MHSPPSLANQRSSPTHSNGNDVAEWVKGLTSHRAGRLLSNHVACVELQTRRVRTDSAAVEAITNERVLIYSLARSLAQHTALPCGIPSQMPRFIAILNLSGERMLAYSDSPALIRCLCTQSRLCGKDLDQAIDGFADWPNERSCFSERFVVLVYSMPWQVGTPGAFWHLSACELTVSEDGQCRVLRDRMLQFNSVAPAPFKGRSVRDISDTDVRVRGPGDPALKLVAPKQLADFAESYSAVNLDLQAPCTDAKAGGQEGFLLDLVQVLKKERQRDQQELRSAKQQLRMLETTMAQALKQVEENGKAMTQEHQRAMESAANTHEDQLKLVRSENNALASEVALMKGFAKNASSEKQKELREHKKLVERFTAHQRQSEAKDALHNAALSQHVATISRLEGLVATNDERITVTSLDLQKEHCAAMDKVHRECEEATGRLTGALESKKRIINQLSENNDRKEVENASLQTHADEQAVRIGNLEVALAEAKTECKRVEAVLKKRREVLPPAAKARSKAVGTHSCNASTATHHCASTQTTPPAPAPAPAPTVGRQVVEEPAPVAQSALPCSLQAAINMIQEHVNLTTQGQSQPVPVPMPMPMPMHPVANGYSRPLPFPHFHPPMIAYQQHANGSFHLPQQSQLQYVHPKVHSRPPQAY